MTETKNLDEACLKCGVALQISSVNYFGKSGTIMLSILACLITAGFFYTAITTSRGGNLGKFLVFGTVAIFTLFYKISKLQRKNLVCLHCNPINTNDI